MRRTARTAAIGTACLALLLPVGCSRNKKQAAPDTTTSTVAEGSSSGTLADGTPFSGGTLPDGTPVSGGTLPDGRPVGGSAGGAGAATGGTTDGGNPTTGGGVGTGGGPGGGANPGGVGSSGGGGGSGSGGSGGVATGPTSTLPDGTPVFTDPNIEVAPGTTFRIRLELGNVNFDHWELVGDAPEGLAILGESVEPPSATTRGPGQLVVVQSQRLGSYTLTFLLNGDPARQRRFEIAVLN